MDDNKSLLETALMWHGMGIAVIPINYMQKIPCVAWKEYQTRLPTLGELCQWFIDDIRIPNDARNLAVITGWRRLVVIDFDDFDLFIRWYGKFPLETHMVSTSRGMHVYLFVDEPVPNRKLTGIDIQSTGKYVLAPPSIHPTGYVYQRFSNSPILSVKTLDDFLPVDMFPDATITGKQGPAVPRSPMAPLHNVGPAVPVQYDPWARLNNPNSTGLIATIKQRFSVLDFVTGVVPSRDGWKMALCPIHDDHSPSLSINPRGDSCKCLAGCNGGKMMDVINLVGQMSYSGDNKQAIEYLKSLL